MDFGVFTPPTIRRVTREVLVGNVGVGGNNPIRIQSMTTSPTSDVQATLDQIMRLSDEGCEIARVTVQGMKEVEACEHIKTGLLNRGYAIPLVADIHFFPKAAMHVIDYVDKVRINPGNYVDKRASFVQIQYDDLSYQQECYKIEERFAPLVEKCKRLHKAMRIGTNHGSLSDRIMSRYGDTPRGMVESALEFARICCQYDYHDLIFSMKSSHPQVMILAYRLLVEEMKILGWDYPLHLGVTEAGEGEDGRIKSAMGIGSLLLDGIGDTIRVSLTEDPWHEIEPCSQLISFANRYPYAPSRRGYTGYPIQRIRPTVGGISLHSDGSVMTEVSSDDVRDPQFYMHLGCEENKQGLQRGSRSSDGVVFNELIEDQHVLDMLKALGITVFSLVQLEGIPVFTLQDFPEHASVVLLKEDSPIAWEPLLENPPQLIFFAPKGDRIQSVRSFYDWMQQHHLRIPVILFFDYDGSREEMLIHAAAECGSLLCDGLGDGLCIRSHQGIDQLRTMSFHILQAARMRMSKTEFISCPGCGRTLFNIQEVAKKIRERTSHLPGVKIAIMGCVVNGPGEMADADFGYVGSKMGKIDLYVGKECVEREVDSEEGEERLVLLLKQYGRWVDP